MKKPVGRPKKNGINFHCQIAPDIKVSINEIAVAIDGSQGDAVAFLVHQYRGGVVGATAEYKLKAIAEIINDSQWLRRVE